MAESTVSPQCDAHHKSQTVKGLYISALVFACIALLGKVLFVVTGDPDSMNKLRAQLVSGAGGRGAGVIGRVVQVGLDGALTLSVVLLAAAVGVQNDVIKLQGN